MEPKALKELRENFFQLTQVDFGKILGVSRRTIQYWESRNTKIPHWVPIVLKSLRKSRK